MLVKKENTEYNPNLPESHDIAKHIEIKDRQSFNDEFHRVFQKLMQSKKMLMIVLKLYRIFWVAMP